MTLRVFTLEPFDPGNPGEVELIDIRGSLARGSDSLVISYHLQSYRRSIDQLIVIPGLTETPVRCNELWQHTCFECFVAGKGEKRYWEYNLSPSGDWNVYQLQDYRSGLQSDLSIHQPFFVHRLAPQRWDMEMTLQIPGPLVACQNLQIGITAVLEHSCHQLSYWALHHGGANADFHSRDSFQMECPAP